MPVWHTTAIKALKRLWAYNQAASSDATVAELKRRDVAVLGETIYLEAVGEAGLPGGSVRNIIELAQVVVYGGL